MAQSRSIVRSVGKAGVNRAEDMEVIQQLLNLIPVSMGGAAPPFFDLGDYGPDAIDETTAAILNFQKTAMAMRTPDGRVDPGGATLRQLNELAYPPAGGFAGSAVIVIPSQGADTGSFESVARALHRDLYTKKTTIVTTTVADSGTVTFRTLHGKRAFSWDSVHQLSSVLTISHGTECNGPNMALDDKALNAYFHQPWGGPFGCDLNAEGKTFWASVGRALAVGGKIILLGCSMGHSPGGYAKKASNASNRRVFAARDKFGSAITALSTAAARSIEAGRSFSPMTSFDPDQ